MIWFVHYQNFVDEGLRRTLSDSKLGEGNKMKVPPRPVQPSQGGKSGLGPTRPPPPRSPMAERKVMNSDLVKKITNTTENLMRVVPLKIDMQKYLFTNR